MTATTASSPLPGLAAFAVLNFANSAMVRVCDPMLPALAGEFAVTTGQAALTVSAYAITYGLMQLVYGPLGDRWGKRRGASYAALATVPGCALAFLAHSLDLLVAARVLAALASAGIIPLVLAWIGDNLPYERRQAIMARFLSASVFGMIAGQWASGVMTEWLGWRSVFAALTVLYLGAGITVLRDPTLKDRHMAQSGARFTSQVREVLSRPWARWMLVIGVLEGAVAFAGITFLASFFVHEFALSLSISAGVIALYGVGGLGWTWFGPALLRRYSESRVIACAAGMLALAWLAIASVTHWWPVIPIVLCAGFAFYALHNILQMQGTQMAPAARGTGVSMFASSMFVGISSGIAVASRIVDQVGFRPVFIICGVGLAVVGGLFSRSLHHTARSEAPLKSPHPL